MSVVRDVQVYLEAQGVVGGSTEWSSIRGTLDDAPGDKLVGIMNDGGLPPEIGRTTGLGSSAFKDPAIQVTVRAPKRDDSEDKADEIYDALHGLTATTMNGTPYDRVAAQTAGPIEVGQDEKARRIHTISFRLATTQGAPT